MSCTVIALPYALAWLMGSVLIGGAGMISGVSSENEALSLSKDYIPDSEFVEDIIIPIEQSIEVDCEEKHVITEKHFLKKKIETPFADKDVLMKTLSEHGINNLRENEFGQIRGVSGDYELTFEKANESSPYSLIIEYAKGFNPESEINSIGAEYTINVQEQSYNQIVENLKNNNMEIENEEIQDDNTIVITVNVD